MKSAKVQQIAESIQTILDKVSADQHRYQPLIDAVDAVHTRSAANLLNYLSLRSFDLRDIQRKLGYLGMSRLARAEAHIEASLKQTLFYLQQLLGAQNPPPKNPTISIKKSEKQLLKNTRRLLGKPRENRRQRIMVTMPAAAAADDQLVLQMMAHGLDVARINCAHDSPKVWSQIIKNIKKADQAYNRKTVITMDIGGPKIRTGELAKPFKIQKGDQLILYKMAQAGHKAQRDAEGKTIAPAAISCTLPEVFDYIQIGHKVYFDDGAIEGTVTELGNDEATITIERTKTGGSKLKPDKGINFPESDLKIRGLTQTDKKHLKYIAQHAHVVNFSFVNSPEDVKEIQEELRALGALDKLGVIYKIETQQAYYNLTGILLEAMKAPKVGVMIARGDLAIEAGWNQMGHIQKEMLALCNACHVPIIWATQVLENLAKKGLPSRSEITDAVNAVKAECVMLNKGPHIVEAIQLLDEIIKDTERYQDKNAPILPRLENVHELLPELSDSH